MYVGCVSASGLRWIKRGMGKKSDAVEAILIALEKNERMTLNTVRFLSLLFVALALAPSLAHPLELPNKINLSHDEYV